MRWENGVFFFMAQWIPLLEVNIPRCGCTAWGRWPTFSCQCRSSCPWRAPGMSLARGRCQGTCCGGAAVGGSPGSRGRGGLWGKGSAALGGEQRSYGGCQGVAQGKRAGGEGGNMWKPENSPVEGSQIKVWVLPCFANQDGTRSGLAKEIGAGPHLYLGWLFKRGSTQPFLEVLISKHHDASKLSILKCFGLFGFERIVGRNCWSR